MLIGAVLSAGTGGKAVVYAAEDENVVTEADNAGNPSGESSLTGDEVLPPGSDINTTDPAGTEDAGENGDTPAPVNGNGTAQPADGGDASPTLPENPEGGSEAEEQDTGTELQEDVPPEPETPDDGDSFEDENVNGEEETLITEEETETVTADALAAYEFPSKSPEAVLQFGRGGIARGDHVYMGTANTGKFRYYSPINAYRVLDRNKANNGDTGAMFLLSETLIGKPYNTGENCAFDESDPKTNKWEDSDARTWCQSFFLNNFSESEQTAIKKTTKTDAECVYEVGGTDTRFYSAETENILNNDFVFFLSAEEALNTDYGFSNTIANHSSRVALFSGDTGYNWWLRSSYVSSNNPSDTNYAGYVNASGKIGGTGVSFDYYYRPAFNLNLATILFSSAYTGGKNTGDLGVNALEAVGTQTVNQYHLTLHDSTRDTFTVSGATLESSGKLTVNYSGVSNVGMNEYISVIVTNDTGFTGMGTDGASGGTIKYYGRVKNVASEGDKEGTFVVNLPGNELVAGDKIYAFTERVSSSGFDLAGQPKFVKTYAKSPYAIHVYGPEGPEHRALSFTAQKTGSVIATPAPVGITVESFGFEPIQIAEDGFVLTGPDADAFTVTKNTALPYPLTLTTGETVTNTFFVGPKEPLAPNRSYDATLVIKTGQEGGEAEIPLNYTITYAEGTRPDGIWMTPVAAQTYAAAKITPAVEVYFGETLLKNTDYTVTYKNNTNAYTKTEGAEGFDEAKAPTITVKGKGNYSGTITQYFVIEPVDLSDSNAKVKAGKIDLNYNGRVQKGTTKVTMETAAGKTVTLKAGTDFVFEYTSTGDGAYKKKGIYDVKISAKSPNFTGDRTIKEEIFHKILISKCAIAKIPAQPFPGYSQESKPVPEITYGGMFLEEGIHYELAYADNKKSGTATVKITGKGDTFYGVVSRTFSINGTSIAKAQVSGVPKSEVYTGTAFTPPVQISLDKGSTWKSTTDNVFTVKYDKNKDPGTAKITISGIPERGYTGTFTKTFKIMPHVLSDASITVKSGSFDWTTSGTDQPDVAYSKSGAKPKPLVYFGSTLLREGVDYTLSWSNNTAIKETLNNKKDPTVTIKGKSAFKGQITRPFKITKRLFNESNMTVVISGATRKAGTPGIAKAPTVAVTEKESNKALKAGADYVLTGTYRYAQTVTLSGGGNRNVGDAVQSSDIIPEGTRIEAEIQGKGNYTSWSIWAEFAYVSPEKSIGAKNVKVTVPDQQWTGKEITLTEADITVLGTDGAELIFNQDYEIISTTYLNNTNRGTAKVTIRGINGPKGYGGTRQIPFKIVAKQMNYTITYRNGESDTVKEQIGAKLGVDPANIRFTGGTSKKSSTPYGGKLVKNAFTVQYWNATKKKYETVPADKYKFLGWATKQGGDVVFKDQAPFKPSWLLRMVYGESVTLYAVWGE